MNLKHSLKISLVFLSLFSKAQNFSGVYKIDQLIKRIDNQDSIYVLNFWATWCKPCVKELPSFDSLQVIKAGKPIKIILVCLDFKEELDKKVLPFLKSKNIQSECILLDEVNGNDFVDKIARQWSGAIPATLFKLGKNQLFIEKKLQLKDLEEQLKKLN